MLWNGCDEVFQIERFKISDVFKMTFPEFFFGNFCHISSRTFYVFQKMSIRGSYECLGFVATVPEKIYFAGGKNGCERIPCDDFSLRTGRKRLYILPSFGRRSLDNTRLLLSVYPIQTGLKPGVYSLQSGVSDLHSKGLWP